MKQPRTSTFRGLTCAASLLCWAIAVLPAWGEATILHDFDSSGGDGYDPYGGVTLVGDTLFGMTWMGGSGGQGVIYSTNTDGSGYSLLHEFAGGPGDGALPHSVLTYGGGKLYGTAWGGGDSDLGVIFQINTDGTGYTHLHEFAGGSAGANPYSSPTLDGDWLYGMTNEGGTDNKGVVFRAKTDGSTYQPRLFTQHRG